MLQYFYRWSKVSKWGWRLQGILFSYRIYFSSKVRKLSSGMIWGGKGRKRHLTLVSEGGANKEFYFRTEFIFPPRWENYLVGWWGEGKAAKGIFQVSESERITNRKTHQWFARRSRILSDSRNKTQADTNRVSRMPICISGLTHMHHSYIHFSRVLRTGGTQRQSTWTVPHGKDTQHGNESTWQLKQGKALGSREGEWAIILRTAPFIGLVQTFPSTGYSTVLIRDEWSTVRGGNQAGEVGRAPSEKSWAHGRDIQRGNGEQDPEHNV